MTLTQIVEDRQAELETELRLCREVLVLLRGGKKSELSKGPIVYGNGHHDGKKPKVSKSGTNSLVHPATLQARAVIAKMLRAHPGGLTTKEMTVGVKQAGIQITDSTVHNALRKLKPVKVSGDHGAGSHNMRYALPQQ